MNYNPTEKWIATDPITVRLPNGDKLQNTHECFLPIPQLPKGSITARIFPGLHTASLLSIGELCDAGCKATFLQYTLRIKYRKEIILTGVRNFTTGMWEVKLPQIVHADNSPKILPETQLPALNSVFRLSTTSSAILYLHAAALFPVKSTWLKAIKNFKSSFYK